MKESVSIVLIGVGFAFAVVFGMIYANLWETNMGVWTIRRIIVLFCGVAGVVAFAVGLVELWSLPVRK